MWRSTVDSREFHFSTSEGEERFSRGMDSDDLARAIGS